MEVTSHLWKSLERPGDFDIEILFDDGSPAPPEGGKMSLSRAIQLGFELQAHIERALQAPAPENIDRKGIG